MHHKKTETTVKVILVCRSKKILLKSSLGKLWTTLFLALTSGLRPSFLISVFKRWVQVNSLLHCQRRINTALQITLKKCLVCPLLPTQTQVTLYLLILC
jgi:hypothetical protein